MTVREVVPILNVSDMEASIEWFVTIGFERGFAWPPGPDERPTFAAVTGDGARVFLCLDGQGGRGEHGAWLSVFVDDVDALHEVCRGAGIEVLAPPDDRPWGVREMHVRHPDGHVLRLGTGVEPD